MPAFMCYSNAALHAALHTALRVAPHARAAHRCFCRVGRMCDMLAGRAWAQRRGPGTGCNPFEWDLPEFRRKLGPACFPQKVHLCRALPRKREWNGRDDVVIGTAPEARVWMVFETPEASFRRYVWLCHHIGLLMHSPGIRTEAYSLRVSQRMCAQMHNCERARARGFSPGGPAPSAFAGVRARELQLRAPRVRGRGPTAPKAATAATAARGTQSRTASVRLFSQSNAMVSVSLFSNPMLRVQGLRDPGGIAAPGEGILGGRVGRPSLPLSLPRSPARHCRRPLSPTPTLALTPARALTSAFTRGATVLGRVIEVVDARGWWARAWGMGGAGARATRTAALFGSPPARLRTQGSLHGLGVHSGWARGGRIRVCPIVGPSDSEACLKPVHAVCVIMRSDASSSGSVP
eukprot:gene1298-biopygen5646